MAIQTGGTHYFSHLNCEFYRNLFPYIQNLSIDGFQFKRSRQENKNAHTAWTILFLFQYNTNEMYSSKWLVMWEKVHYWSIWSETRKRCDHKTSIQLIQLNDRHLHTLSYNLGLEKTDVLCTNWFILSYEIKSRIFIHLRRWRNYVADSKRRQKWSSKKITKGLTVKGTSPSESLRQPVYHPTLDYRSRSSGYQSLS